MKFCIKDAVLTCGYGLDDRIARCYSDFEEFQADNEQDALIYVEKLQKSTR